MRRGPVGGRGLGGRPVWGVGSLMETEQAATSAAMAADVVLVG